MLRLTPAPSLLVPLHPALPRRRNRYWKRVEKESGGEHKGKKREIAQARGCVRERKKERKKERERERKKERERQKEREREREREKERERETASECEKERSRRGVSRKK